VLKLINFQFFSDIVTFYVSIRTIGQALLHLDHSRQSSQTGSYSFIQRSDSLVVSRSKL